MATSRFSAIMSQQESLYRPQAPHASGFPEIFKKYCIFFSTILAIKIVTEEFRPFETIFIQTGKTLHGQFLVIPSQKS